MKGLQGKMYEGWLRSFVLIQPGEEESEGRAHGDVQLPHKGKWKERH